jgi:hypothetical protein
LPDRIGQSSIAVFIFVAVFADRPYRGGEFPFQDWSPLMHFALILMQTTMDPEQAKKMAMIFLAIMPIVYIVFLAIVILPFWFICKKAGFSPWLSLLNIVPFGNIVLIYVLAFANWKVAPIPQPQIGYPYPPPQL